jgi:hypothetical protein
VSLHSRTSDSLARLVYVLPVAGLAFWFFLAYPFGNHNESLLWMVSFDGLQAGEIWTRKLEATASLRPLGQSTAYYLYVLGGRSDVLVQLFNFAMAALAWFSVITWIPNRRLYALVAFFCTGMFFSGYVYLFHIHGVFYSPLLLAVAYWAYQERESGRPIGPRDDFNAFLISALAFAYHPYSFLLFIALLAGRALGQISTWRNSHWAMRLALMAVAIAAVLLARPEHHQAPVSTEALAGLLASYRLTELSTPVSVAAGLLALVASLTMTSPRTGARWAWVAAIAVSAVALLALRAPVIPLWILACLAKCVGTRRTGLAALVAAAALLPMIAPSGSPTYAIFVVFLCATVTAMGTLDMTTLRVRALPALAVMVLLLLLGVILAIRGGVDVPIATNVARPLLAEKERTVQLDELLTWAMQSPYAGDNLALAQDVVNPVGSLRAAAQRERRPPTYQRYIEPYWKHAQARSGISPEGGHVLLVVFGDAEPDAAELGELVYERPGRFAGKVRVWRSSSPTAEQ